MMFEKQPTESEDNDAEQTKRASMKNQGIKQAIKQIRKFIYL